MTGGTSTGLSFKKKAAPPPSTTTAAAAAAQGIELFSALAAGEERRVLAKVIEREVPVLAFRPSISASIPAQVGR